jgi:hypothetical protein
MRCHSVGCGTVSETQPATQLTTQSFAVAHMMHSFVFTTEPANVIETNEHKGISKIGNDMPAVAAK